MKQTIKNLKLQVLINLSICLLSLNVFSSIELNTFFKDKCQSSTGFIVKIEEDKLFLLNKLGKTEILDIKKVEKIVVHNLTDFPWTLSEINQDVPWYKVNLLDQNNSSFIGTPIQFIDKLIFFLNQYGSLEVISIDQIASISNFQNRAVNWKGKITDLNWGENINLKCSLKNASQNYPTRILEDAVQISEYLHNFEQGFEKLIHLKERMNFYSKPILFNTTTRMGFNALFGNLNPESPELPILLNFKFSSGVPFGLQNSTEVLNIQSSWVPQYFPFTGAQFEIKSHLFHALLVTHLTSLSGGSSYFSPIYSGQSAGKYKQAQGSAYPDGTALTMQHSFNYLTVFGIDWQKWSVSFGGFYPIHYVYSYSGSREYLSEGPQPVFRLMYTDKNFKIRLIGSKFNINHDNNTNSTTLIAFDNEGKKITHYLTSHTDGYFLRAGADFNLFKQIEVRSDLSVFKFKSEDSLNYYAENIENTLALSIGKSFGRYISLRAYTAQVQYQWNAEGLAGHQDRSLEELYYGTELEFLF